MDARKMLVLQQRKREDSKESIAKGVALIHNLIRTGGNNDLPVLCCTIVSCLADF
jgi:hypothetical protein